MRRNWDNPDYWKKLKR